MAMQLSRTQLPHLLSWLEQHLPHSFKVHRELKNHLRGHFPDLEFYVDKWPHPQAVVARVNPTSEQIASHKSRVSVFGVDWEAVSGVCKSPQFISWNGQVIFSVVPVNLQPALQIVARDLGKSMRVIPTILMKASPQDVKPLPVPEGMKCQPITTAEIRVIRSTSVFAYDRPEAYIESLVERYPSLYLVTETGQHVGHMVGNSYGAMGMLYVNPEFRGRGYGKVIISQLAQKYFERGEDAYVFVTEDNVSSQTLHKSIGFREVLESKFACIIWD